MPDPLYRIVNGVRIEIPEPEAAAIRDAWAAADAAKPAAEMARLRSIRDALLRESDHTQLTDAPLTGGRRAQWVTYRKALRDWPSTVPDPFNPPAWPTPPNGGT